MILLAAGRLTRPDTIDDRRKARLSASGEVRISPADRPEGPKEALSSRGHCSWPLAGVADEHGEAAEDDLQAEVVGVLGTVGGPVGGACGGSDAGSQRIAGRVNYLLQQGRMR